MSNLFEQDWLKHENNSLREKIARLQKEVEFWQNIAHDVAGELNDMPKPAKGGRDTSEQAAKKILVNVGTWRHKVLSAISEFPQSSTEIAEQLGTEIINVRPRLAELGNAGYISDTEARRSNDKGNSEIVWQITTMGEMALRGQI